MHHLPIHSPHRRLHHRDARRDARHEGGDHREWLHGLGGRRRGGVRRGEIRPLILAALARRPMHGYEVIQELEVQSGGRWRPSAGSVYPTLQQLSDEGLVTGSEIDGRRTYTLTDAGQAAAAAAPLSRPRWSTPNLMASRTCAGSASRSGAVMQVQRVGSPSARREATRFWSTHVARSIGCSPRTRPGLRARPPVRMRPGSPDEPGPA